MFSCSWACGLGLPVAGVLGLALILLRNHGLTAVITPREPQLDG
jgi:hypothetical protein